MKKIYRTMSIDDYLSRIDRESLSSRQQLDTLRGSNSFKTDQQSLLIKLKNENFQKTLKLKSLKDLVGSYLCGKSDSEPNSDAFKRNERSSLTEVIQDLENKAKIESGYTEQLRRMRLNVKENIDTIKKNNLELEKSIKQLEIEHEKALKFTSNAKSWQISAQSSLNLFSRTSLKTLAERKKSITDKKSEQISLTNFIRNKSEDIHIKEIEQKQITTRKIAFLSELKYHLEKNEKLQKSSKIIKAKLFDYTSTFGIIFQKIGYKGIISQEAVNLIIESLKKRMFWDGSLSEQYMDLSQIHNSKVGELNDAIKELKLLIGNFKDSNFELKSDKTFNMLRSGIGNTERRADDNMEKVVLAVYVSTLSIFHRFHSQIRAIDENSELNNEIQKYFKHLENSLASLKREGRRTLFKALSEQTISVERKNNLFFNSKLSIEEIFFRYYPEEKNLGLKVALLIKQSPVMKFVLNLESIEKFAQFKDPIKDFVELIKSCFQKLYDNYENVVDICTNLLLALSSQSESKPTIKSQISITDIRRNCLHIKTSISLLPTKTTTPLLPNPRKKSRISDKDLNSIESIQQKIELLRNYHKRATKSSENLKNAHK